MTTTDRQLIRRRIQQETLREIGDIPPEPPPDPVAALEAEAYQRTCERVQSLLEPRRRQQQGIPVRCAETGVVYPSIRDAALALKTSYFAAYQSVALGYRCKGKRLRWVGKEGGR